MTEISPTQVALRELTMLTKCYCDGQYDGVGHPHPRLGHNCSFRRDVLTLVDSIGAVLRACNEAIAANDPRFPAAAADDIRRALLGLPAYEDPPWDSSVVPPVAHSAQVAERLQRAEADRRLSEEREGPSGPG